MRLSERAEEWRAEAANVLDSVFDDPTAAASRAAY
jgi:hypothetical protein